MSDNKFTVERNLYAGMGEDLYRVSTRVDIEMSKEEAEDFKSRLTAAEKRLKLADKMLNEASVYLGGYMGASIEEVNSLRDEIEQYQKGSADE